LGSVIIAFALINPFWNGYIPRQSQGVPMKMLLIGILALSASATYAQSLTKAQFASLLTERKATLEAVNAGMSKKVVTTGVFAPEEDVICDYTQVSTQSVLRIEGDKIIVLSEEEFFPGKGLGCQGVEKSLEKVVFFEAKPSLTDELADLEASDVQSITKNGDIVTMVVNGTITDEDGTEETQAVTVKYDLTKSSFKNVLSTETKDLKSVTTEAADKDLTQVDLKKVTFCPASDSPEEECMEGDFSDILF
jgi:hypothetical protein